MRALVCATKRTNSAAAVAMPERWPTKLSAVRSAASSARTAPNRLQRGLFRACGAVAHVGGDLDRGIELAKDRGGDWQPRDRARLARRHHGAAARALRDGRGRGDLAGAAEILGERARDRLVDRERGEEGVGTKERHGQLARSVPSPRRGEGWGEGLSDYR